MSFQPAHPDSIFKSHQAEDPRLSSHLTSDPGKAQVHLWGYPDDEGIRLNGGRIGAALGPDEIRKVFYKMTPPVSSPNPFTIWDGGNLSLTTSLKERHENAISQGIESYEKNRFVLTLGGGHDYGYPDSKAFTQAFLKSKKKPVVINFDAHLDVRPLDKGLTSGTPFHRLLLEHSKDIHFFEVGIQDHCNSQAHRQWCESHNGHILFQKDIQKKGLVSSLRKSLTKLKGHPAFLSVDIDAFSSTIAPGCSQSWPTGFNAEEFFLGLGFLFQHLNIKGVGIYEVSPPLDLPPLTSRLAALILYRSLQMKGLL